jgi:uncharacterized protein YbjQ (UPF0145 family)
MLVSTTDVVPGQAYHVLGFVADMETLGLHVGRDILLRITDWIGGRSRVLDKQAQVALQAAAARMVDRARQMGANAILGVRMQIQPVGIKRTAMVQAIIYGTAVKLVPLEIVRPAAGARAATLDGAAAERGARSSGEVC